MPDLKNTNYVIVVDYVEGQTLEDCFLLGWNDKYDWFDCDTCGWEILTKTGRVKKNKYGLLLDIDRWVSVYVTDVDDTNYRSYCDDGNREGYDCTVCKLEKDGDDYKLIPTYPVDEDDEDDE
jgi:hypothetical protein